jgi:thermitase
MSYEYVVAGQTVRLQVDPSVVAVRFAPSAPKSARAAATAAAGVGPFSHRVDIPGEGLSLVQVPQPGPGPAGAPMAAGAKNAIEALKAQPTVHNALPVFRVGTNRVIAADRIIVGAGDKAVQDALGNKYSMTILRVYEDKVVYQLPEASDPFEVAKSVAAEPGVRFAEPDFITVGRHVPQRVASDQHSSGPLSGPRQYAMEITRAFDARALQDGAPQVRVAILDEGVDTEHPDLKPIVAGTFDAVDDDTYQEPNAWDGHGTACAGLAVGSGPRATGVQGSGAGCSLLAVRIAFSEFKNGPWITTNDTIARAIAWSWRNGAWVLSNSWGGGAPSSAIIEEIEKARTLGRNGLGCVVAIAAGNSFSSVQFPATIPNVIAVSASNEYDEAKTPTSRDGEEWWGTCHGEQIGVAAPGVHNLTTDITGTNGYDQGNYAAAFNGTSSATPIVAGACALVLSAKPSLTEKQVRDIVTASADKVGPYGYDAQGRNDFFGFGRLNVLGAIQLARATS